MHRDQAALAALVLETGGRDLREVAAGLT